MSTPSEEQRLREELTRLRVKYVLLRRQRDYARQALEFYGSPGSWLFRHDPQGGVRQSEAAEDRGLLARSVLMEVDIVESEATENRKV